MERGVPSDAETRQQGKVRGGVCLIAIPPGDNVRRMITRTPARRETRADAALPAWQRELRDAVTRLDELLEILELDKELFAGDQALVKAASRDFPLRVPRGFVARMRRGDANDPLLLQVLPRAVEMQVVPGYAADPLAELALATVPGLLHKYHGRALLVLTGACAIHCRYCFRRHFPYSSHVADWRPALDYLARDTSIHEVLLSGGDPLTLSDDRLAEVAGAIADLGHVRRLRIHTRLPVVLPERVDAAFLRWFCGNPGLRPVLVIHANHARELSSDVVAALERLRQAGVVLLNQSVLLRGVNNSVRALRDLSKTLFEAGVMPYYLHVLDRVAGAAHFDVAEDEAGRLIRDLMGELPGYLVPKLVREVPGAPAKMLIDSLNA
jgi:L-lysine 2,3-aminomutase